MRTLQGDGAAGEYLKVGATCKHLIGNDLEEWKGFTRCEGAPGLGLGLGRTQQPAAPSAAAATSAAAGHADAPSILVSLPV